MMPVSPMSTPAAPSIEGHVYGWASTGVSWGRKVVQATVRGTHEVACVGSRGREPLGRAHDCSRACPHDLGEDEGSKGDRGRREHDEGGETEQEKGRGRRGASVNENDKEEVTLLRARTRCSTKKRLRSGAGRPCVPSCREEVRREALCATLPFRRAVLTSIKTVGRGQGEISEVERVERNARGGGRAWRRGGVRPSAVGRKDRSGSELRRG